MKNKFLLLLTLSILFVLTACGKAQTAETTAAATTAATSAATPATTAAAVAATTPAATTAAPETTAAASVESGLVILYEQDDSMINTYSVLAVNPDAPFVDADGKAVADVAINQVGGQALVNWLLSEEGQKAASEYGFADYGEYLFYLKDGRPVSTQTIPNATEDTKAIRLSTTTSVNDSGLLGYLLPMFEAKYGYTVEVYSAGTGKAIANAKAGNADVILVHSKKQEEDFVAAGYSYVLPGLTSERNSYMYNFFVLCGPASDPAGVKSCPDVKTAFKAIADGSYPFVSRGDNSGTHTKEISLWPEELGITAEADSIKNYSWYTYSNAGMAVCLAMAEQQGAYILSDKATFLTYKASK